MRQGNDVGSQYRSVCYCDNEDSLGTVKASMDQYQKALQEKGLGVITTEIKSNQPYFFAEEYHQQYLDKNPNGYCGIGGTGCEFQA
jgi:peptide-methionine (S)-S-oxide reductase